MSFVIYLGLAVYNKLFLLFWAGGKRLAFRKLPEGYRKKGWKATPTFAKLAVLGRFRDPHSHIKWVSPWPAEEKKRFTDKMCMTAALFPEFRIKGACIFSMIRCTSTAHKQMIVFFKLVSLPPRWA